MLELANDTELHFPPPRILVVENDALHRDIIATILPPPLYFVDFARNGVEGLEMALTRPYDLVLTDLRMPEMTGDKMVEALRRHSYLLGTCQIAVMSTVPYKVIGVTEYLQKPFKPAELKQLVEKQVAIAFRNRMQQGYAVLRSNKLTLGYDGNGMPRLAWGETGQDYKLDPRLLPLSATYRQQKDWRILQYCDDQAESSLMADFLRAHGFQVEIAASHANFPPVRIKDFTLSSSICRWTRLPFGASEQNSPPEIRPRS